MAAVGGRGRPREADTAEDQCEAITILTDWKRRQKVKDLRCVYFVKLLVNGKRLCFRHALMEALSVCITTGKAKIIHTHFDRPRYSPVPVGKKEEPK